MMRGYSVTQIKMIMKGKVPFERRRAPALGSRIRRIYDVLVSGGKFKCSDDRKIAGMERTAITQLRDSYEMDIVICEPYTFLLLVDHVQDSRT